MMTTTFLVLGLIAVLASLGVPRRVPVKISRSLNRRGNGSDRS